METQQTAEHAWLMRMVGSWAFTHAYDFGGESGESNGTEVVRALGDLWVVGEMSGEMPGGCSMDSVITLGFDAVRGRVVGTWIGSPSSHLWVYNGELELASDTLTLNTRGPSFEDPEKMVDYQDVVTLANNDERRLSSQYRNPDGSWTRFMDAVYRRQG